jgi:carbon-monoxide dehydrogenase small subunit
MTERRSVTITVNGEVRSGEAEPRMLLADFLREALGLTGTHVGCEHGVCGACTVIVDGQAARACLMLAVQADGARVLTVEGLATGDGLHPLQSAFSKHHGLQCGFCTPGMLMVALDFVAASADPSADEIKVGMSAAICRCTGYDGILKAVTEYATEQGEAHARRTIEGGP